MRIMRFLCRGMVLLAVCGMMFTLISCGTKYDTVSPSMFGENVSDDVWLYKYYLSESLTLKAAFKPKIVIEEYSPGKLVEYDDSHITISFGGKKIVFKKYSTFYMTEEKIQLSNGTYKAKKLPTLQYSSRDLWLSNENAPSVEDWMPSEDTSNETEEIIADIKADIEADDTSSMSLENMTESYAHSIPEDELRNFKYYLSVPLVLEREIPYDSAAYASEYGYVMRDGVAYERIEIGTDAAGKLMKIDAVNKILYICFSSDSSRMLGFTLKKDTSPLKMKKRIVEYGGNDYTVKSDSPNLKFYLDRSYETTTNTIKETGAW